MDKKEKKTRKALKTKSPATGLGTSRTVLGEEVETGTRQANLEHNPVACRHATACAVNSRLPPKEQLLSSLAQVKETESPKDSPQAAFRFTCRRKIIMRKARPASEWEHLRAGVYIEYNDYLIDWIANPYSIL